jgi:hypothetical protein
LRREKKRRRLKLLRSSFSRDKGQGHLFQHGAKERTQAARAVRRQRPHDRVRPRRQASRPTVLLPRRVDRRSGRRNGDACGRVSTSPRRSLAARGPLLARRPRLRCRARRRREAPAPVPGGLAAAAVANAPASAAAAPAATPRPAGPCRGRVLNPRAAGPARRRRQRLERLTRGREVGGAAGERAVAKGGLQAPGVAGVVAAAAAHRSRPAVELPSTTNRARRQERQTSTPSTNTFEIYCGWELEEKGGTIAGNVC